MSTKRKYGDISRGGKPRYTAVASKLAKRSRTAVRAAMAAVVPGYTRTGGSYGRYGGAARRLGLAPELKFFDTALAFNFDSAIEVPATGQLCLIPQGDTESQRDGRKATIRSIQIRGNATFAPAAAATAATTCHLWLVLDTQCNGAAAAASDVFTPTGTAGDASLTMLQLNNSGRFRILKHWDMVFNPAAGATTAYNNAVKHIEFYKKCNYALDWNATTGAITEIKSNNIFLVAGAAGSDDLVSFAGTCRVRFQG